MADRPLTQDDLDRCTEAHCARVDRIEGTCTKLEDRMRAVETDLVRLASSSRVVGLIALAIVPVLTALLIFGLQRMWPPQVAPAHALTRPAPIVTEVSK